MPNAAEDLLGRSDAELAPSLFTTPRRTKAVFRPVLAVLAEASEPVTPEQIGEKLDWKRDKIRSVLTALVAADARLFALTTEFMPSMATMMDLVEARMNAKIGPGNLHEANGECARIVRSIINPRYESFLRRELRDHIDEHGTLAISVPEMVEFLGGDYRTFVKQQDQGLTSKVGGLNEAILARGLSNSGLTKGSDFDVTGTRGNGDLAVYCNATRPRAQLLVEVKSYGARERLLRGLQDIRASKIGVGFFNRADEFNSGRTTQFLGTQALAIYMPKSTHDELEDASRTRMNHRGSSFYRPLEAFLGDIRAFTLRGEAAFDP